MKTDKARFFSVAFLSGLLALILFSPSIATAQTRAYENRLRPIQRPKPLLADFPEWVEPIRETRRFEAPILVDDEDADLMVRAWRFSFNARGIVELPKIGRASCR